MGSKRCENQCEKYSICLQPLPPHYYWRCRQNLQTLKHYGILRLNSYENVSFAFHHHYRLWRGWCEKYKRFWLHQLFFSAPAAFVLIIRMKHLCSISFRNIASTTMAKKTNAQTVNHFFSAPFSRRLQNCFCFIFHHRFFNHLTNDFQWILWPSIHWLPIKTQNGHIKFWTHSVN